MRAEKVIVDILDFIGSFLKPKASLKFQSVPKASRHEVVLLVFGEGGHSAAMHRLHNKLDLSRVSIIQLRETRATPIANAPEYIVEQIMPKQGAPLQYIGVPFRLFQNAIVVATIFVNFRVKFIVTTGPIIAFLPCILGRISGAQSVFIESWARFSSISRTGKLLMMLGTTVYYQNWELAALLPRGRYCGRV